MTENNVTGTKFFTKEGVEFDPLSGKLRVDGSIDLSKLEPSCGQSCAALAAASSAQSMAMGTQAKVAVLEAELAGFRAEVQAMIDAATATDKARLWNMACFRAGREDLQVSVLNFADDSFKVALVSALGGALAEALSVPLTIGETPKAPWL